MLRKALVVGLCAAAATFGGCGKPDLKRGTAPESSPAAQNAAPRAAAGAVSKRLAGAKRGSPSATVLGLWRRMQQGVPQLAIVAYDPRVLARLGLPAMEGGLRAQQRFFQSSVPTIRGSERTAAGLLAVVSVQPRSVAPDQTFLFRRVGRTWVILFDTVLEQGLDAYARVSTPFQGTKAKTERLAAARAAALAERYRLLTAPRSAARP